MRNSLQINITLPADVNIAAVRFAEQNYTKLSQLMRGLLIEKLRKEGYLPTPATKEEGAE